MSYIGKVQIGSNSETLVGSTLYGICESAIDATTKTVTLSSFDTLMNGITVHVRFVNGNSVTSGLSLAVGSATAQTIVGNCICNANDVVAFTYYEETINDVLTKRWYVNSNIVVEEGSSDGTIKVNGQAATVHGLGTAAYTASTAYATAAQGTKADAAMPVTGGTFTGTISGPSVDDNSASGTLATVDYVRDKTGGLSGLVGAMHFKGTSTTTVTDGGTQNPTINGTEVTTRDAGDVVLYGNQEYVWNGSAWELLGDEGSYALRTSTASIGSASGWNAGSAPTLGTAIDADDITDWSAGSASSAVVESGVLRLTNSVVPTLSYTAKSIPNVTDVGSAPQLTVSSTTVVVP